MENESISPEPPVVIETPALPDRIAAIAHHMAALEDLADPALRTDGWTPFARKLFLQVVAETGRVSTACEYASLSKQSAYALRARDALFAAGWDAACFLARTPLADRLYEQAVDGITDTITREDGKTITRHRVDSRLSIAVLNRLDRRCDRAAEAGSRHLGAVGQWDTFVAAIGADDCATAQAIIDAHTAAVESARLDSAKLSQPSQLRPGPDQEMEEEIPEPRIWWEMGRKEYRTSFPPPEGEQCHEQGEVGHRDYNRSLTAEEADLFLGLHLAEAAELRAADDVARKDYFDRLREDMLAMVKPAPDGTAGKPGSKQHRSGFRAPAKGVKSSRGP